MRLLLTIYGKPTGGRVTHSFSSKKMATTNLVTLLLLLFANLNKNSWGVRVFIYHLDPKENPDYDRYPVTHPSLEVFEPLPQFATLRSLPLNKSHLVNYTKLIEKYCLDPNTTLGGIIWPVNPNFMFADNYEDFIDYIQDKNLYITSVHGFSPVSKGYTPPKEVLNYLDKTLDTKWFGMANGEQDGHYFGTFIREEIPLSNQPLDQFLSFRDYFDEMEKILGPKLTTLLSSTYPHQQLKTGLYTIAGAETSQHGPNAQIRYSFIRGAGKQYGVIWFGNVSIYNRFGHKVYSKKDRVQRNSLRKSGVFSCSTDKSVKGHNANNIRDSFGPTCGTSLNLMKRLMYAQIMYNSGYVSFEGSWFYENDDSNQLTPIGMIQHNAYRWVSQKKVSLGKHLATVAVYLDYYNGWAAPRQNKQIIYRTWMNLPYTPADYLTDGLLRLMYPSYQDSSYFHDETGISSPTPYGDIMDVILTDAPPWILKAYDTIIVSSPLKGGEEIARNLLEYVQSGGNLVITAENLATLPKGHFDITVTDDCKPVQADQKVHLLSQNNPILEQYNMTVCHLEYQQGAPVTVLAWLNESTPLVVQTINERKGSLVVFATNYAISSTQTAKPVSEIDQPLTTPYPLLDHTSEILQRLLSKASIIRSTSNLSIVTNYIDTNKLLVLVSNPLLKQQPLHFIIQNGNITSVQEIILDQSEKGQIGYVPDGYENAKLGKNTATTIAGGDTRLFQLTTNLKMIKIKKPVAKPRPIGIALHIRHIILSLQREIYSRPTFFQHYDSVVIDYSYLITKDEIFLEKEKKWLHTQKVKVYVDATSSINLFPSLRLTSDAPDLYNKSINSFTLLLAKMAKVGSKDLVLCLHIFPGDQSKKSTFEQFNTTLHYLNKLGKLFNISLHILDTPKNQLSLLPMSRWLDTYNLSTIKFVLSTSALLDYEIYKYDTLLATRTSLLYVNAPGWDLFGMKYTNNAPITKNETTKHQVTEVLKHICSLACCPYNKLQQTSNKLVKEPREYKYSSRQCHTILPIVMDGLYFSQDEEFSDVRTVEELLTPS